VEVERSAQPGPKLTGEPRVDEALARLDELGRLPVTEHPGLLGQVHRQLGQVLEELDAQPS
jgi:hypothetical protein